MKAMMDLHAVARRLGIAEWPNKTGTFCSPLRPDASESFSIYERNGEIKWKDFSPSGDGGGDQIDLIMAYLRCDKKAAIEWMERELGIDREVQQSRPGKKNSRPKRLVATYDYRSVGGLLMHQTLRFAYTDEKGGKTFMQRRPAKQGEKAGIYEAKLEKNTGKWWIWNLYGIEPVLYHLPEIASRPDEDVWLFEGEKDADNAAKIGLLTTTSPMGATRWRDSFTDALRGRSVTIVPDRDDPGIRHATMVALALLKADCTVQIIRWDELWPSAPDGKLDFTDWAESYLRKEVAA